MDHNLPHSCNGARAEQNCLACETRPFSVCAVLSVDELSMLNALGNSVRFGPKDTLLVQGQPAPTVYNITSGTVRLYTLLPDGRRQIVGFALPGDFIGLSMHETANISAEAIDAVGACTFPRATYSALADSKPFLLRRLHDLATRELTLAQEQMMLLGRRSAEEKIICFLLTMQQRWARIGRSSVTVPLPMSRQDIADFLGLTIETVSRTLTRLARDRTILLVPDGVRLVNSNRMAMVAAA